MQLGLLPKHMKSGRSYTNAVDLWALGVVVHELLTSEIIFLDNAGRSIYSANTIDSVPAIDIDLLYNYCRDSELFPVSRLQSNGVSEEWQGFLKRLMAVDPTIRLTAADALSKIWVIEIDTRLLGHRLNLLPVQVQNQKMTRFLACDRDYTIALVGYLVRGSLDDIRKKSASYAEYLTVRDVPPKPDNAEVDLALLQMAASHGQIDLIQLMLDRGADINAKSRGFKNQTTLQLHPHVVNFHREAVQQYGITPLQAAAAGGHLDAVSLLILNGADVNMGAGEEGGVTALNAATRGGHLEVMRLLLTHGAKLLALAREEAYHGRPKHGIIDPFSH